MDFRKLNLKTIPIYGNLSSKHQKTVNLIMGGVACAGVVATVSWLMDGSGPSTTYTPPPKSVNVGQQVNAPGSKIEPQQYWMTTQGKRLDRIEELLTQMKPQAAAAATVAASAATTQQETAANPGPLAPNKGVDKQGAIAKDDQGGPTPYPRQPEGGLPNPTRGGNGQYNPNAPGANMGLTNYPPTLPNGGGSAPQAIQPTTPQAPGMTSVPIVQYLPQGMEAAKKVDPLAGIKNVERNFLPVGFVRAELIGGLDAATGGQAQNDPQPVLFHLQDDAILPNGWRSKIRNCFVVGAGIGDLSSERAFIRLVTLSCVMKSGQAVEAKIVGSAFGEDGKNGLRGRLVSKQGSVLANAAMASIASGIGNGFGKQGQTVSVSPLGTTTQQSQDAEVVLRNSVASGFGSAMDRLAQYWIERADKMFPVIEVDASRKVDLLITKGVQLEGVPGEVIEDDEDQPTNTRHIDRAAAINKLVAIQ